MTPTVMSNEEGPPLEVAEISAALSGLLKGRSGPRAAVEQLSVRPSPYRTSSALFEVDATLESGETLELMLKSLERSGLHPTARRVKPRSLHDPRREPAVYRELLAAAGLGTARYYGEWVDPALGRRWLFLERVSGVTLAEVGDLTAWHDAARWLARLHLRFEGQARRLASDVPLLLRDKGSFRPWLERAISFHPGDMRPSIIEKLERASGLAGGRLEALPGTLVHCEFYATNVLIRAGGPPGRVCPVDWETAGLGPGLIDLAALASGNWSDDDRLGMVAAYRDAFTEAGGTCASHDRFLADLDACRFLAAIKWLGWSPDWEPPAGQSQDWLGEAIALADAITCK